jgi:hypothetical protein
MVLLLRFSPAFFFIRTEVLHSARWPIVDASIDGVMSYDQPSNNTDDVTSQKTLLRNGTWIRGGLSWSIVLYLLLTVLVDPAIRWKWNPSFWQCWMPEIPWNAIRKSLGSRIGPSAISIWCHRLRVVMTLAMQFDGCERETKPTAISAVSNYRHYLLPEAVKREASVVAHSLFRSAWH